MPLTRALSVNIKKRMRTIRIAIIILLAIYSGNRILAQSDHLEPVSGIFDSSDAHVEYFSKVKKILFQGLNNSPNIRFLIIPSFTPESVVVIEYDRTTKKFVLVYQVCDKNIWYNKNGETTHVTRKSKEINGESVEMIGKLFETAIQGVEFQKGQFLGCDGDSYFFSVNINGSKTGMTWSPNKETKMRRLVNIGLELIKLATNEKTLVKLDGNLKAQIIQLTNDLK